MQARATTAVSQVALSRISWLIVFAAAEGDDRAQFSCLSRKNLSMSGPTLAFLGISAGLFGLALVIFMSNVNAATSLPIASITLGFSLAGGLGLIAAALTVKRP
jgi:hypothetical protein